MSFTPPIVTSRGPELDKREVALAVDQMGRGRSNAFGTVTLAENQATTTVDDDNVGAESFIGLTPKTANAAAELGNGTLYISAQSDGSFTLTHANNPQTDRTFTYAIQG